MNLIDGLFLKIGFKKLDGGWSVKAGPGIHGSQDSADPSDPSAKLLVYGHLGEHNLLAFCGQTAGISHNSCCQPARIVPSLTLTD